MFLSYRSLSFYKTGKNNLRTLEHLVSCSSLCVAEMRGNVGEIAQSKDFEARRRNLESLRHPHMVNFSAFLCRMEIDESDNGFIIEVAVRTEQITM